MRLATLTYLILLGSTASLSAQSITTIFTGTTSGHGSATAVRPSTSFDLTVTNPAGIVVNSFDLNIVRTGVSAGVEFWFTDVGGSYLNGLSAPAPDFWKLRSTASVVTAGTNNPTVATLDKPIVLLPGTYGVTLIYKRSVARYYTTAAGGLLQYSNADVTLDLGAGQQNAWTSGINTPRITSMSMYYGLLNIDVVDFTADIESGPSSHTVNFTDLSYLTSPATSWEWDFDNDGTIDSTAQNPTHVYTVCGDYSVRLRLNGSIERVWTDLIHIDPLTVDFEATPDSGLPPLNNVAFTDLSTGTPAVQLWDFDGDGVTDSTLPNPTWDFGPGGHGVELTVINGCRQESMTRRVTSVTDILSTSLAGSANIGTPGSIMFFDLNVTATEELIVAALDCNSLNMLNNVLNIEVYLTDTTWVGKEVQPDAWRRVAVGSGRAKGANRATKFVLDRPFLLLPGQSYGVGIRYVDCHGRYLSSGNTVPVSNADMALTFGGSVNTIAGPFTDTTVTQPRGFSGSFHYVKRSQWPMGSLNWFGLGCPGALGVPELHPGAGERLLLGTTTTTTITNMPVSAGLMLLGLSNTTSPFGPLPLNLQALGMPGCFARVDPFLSLLMLGANNEAIHSLAVPNNAALAGFQLFMQSMVLDPAANAFGAVMSDAAVGLVGIY